MVDESGRSKGFGFVCFENQEDAMKAISEMSNKMIGSKPLYVAVFQRKDERKALLASQHMQRLASVRMQNPSTLPGIMYAPAGNGGFFMSPPQRAMVPTAMAGAQMRAGAPRWNAANAGGFGELWVNSSCSFSRLLLHQLPKNP